MLFIATVYSQSSADAGLLPSINLIYKKQDYAFNFRLESRQFFYENKAGASGNLKYNYALTDFTMLAAKKVDFDKTVALGYLMRWEGDELIHRTIQQLIITKKLSGYKLTHRIATDQTFSSREATEYRLRYRIATEFPLSGREVDAKEFYFKLNNEYLNSLQSSTYDLEIRVLPFLGYEISQGNDVEIGIDYRLNSFITNQSRHRFFLGINWFKIIQ